MMHARRKGGIDTVALYNPMIGEHPQFFFLHFWGKGTSQELARGVRAALDAQTGVAAQARHH